jgi:uncharacterized protein YyaL (SSP411 family)
MAELLLRLHAMTEREEHQTRALRYLESMATPMVEQPIGFGRVLCAADLYRGPVREIALAGKADDPGTRDFVVAIAGRYEPNAVIGLADPDEPAFAEQFPFLQHRPQRNGGATAYLCERHTCMPPVTTPAELHRLLDEGIGVEWVSF